MSFWIWRENNIFGFFGVQHANQGQKKYGINREDARKTIGSNEILKIRTKLPNPSGDIKRRIFCHWGTSKRCFLGWKYIGECFRLKQLFLYLSKLVRVFLINGHVRRVDNAYTKSTLHTQAHLHVHMAHGRIPCSPILNRVF